MDYSGTIEESGERQTWNGSGRFGFDGFGRFDARTEAEVLDDTACSSEAISGTTTVEAGEDTVVITYDGETDCDDTSTVRWSLNGADQGELEGVRCSVGPGTAGPPAWLLVLLAVAPLRRLRRVSRG